MKKYIISALAIGCALCSNARYLSPEEALSRFNSEAEGPAKAMAAASAKPIYTVEAAQAGGMAYVFNRGENAGFVVVSADDCAPALLGYSENGSFDPSNIPPALRAWLDEYARQINWMASHPQISLNGTPMKAEVKKRAEIAPKIKTRWNQDFPYWNMTPVNSAGKHAYTGCVATAMAQVMNYHKYPEKGTGTIRYYSPYAGGYVGCNLDTITFKYDKMLDTYDVTSPKENQDAVAELMMAVGLGAEMVYSNTGSGAATNKMALAMFKYFGYDKGLSYQLRTWYGIEEWNDMVYNELANNGPVYYDGTGDGGGHAFVCDGYRAEDGLFHFNWGWGGMSDGYFRLEALAPTIQGAGGYADNYSFGQGIIKDLRKAVEGSEVAVIFAPYAGVKAAQSTVVPGKFLSLLGYETNDGFCNYSVDAVSDIYLGHMYVNNATKDVLYSEAVTSASNTKPVGPRTWQAYTRQNIVGALVPDTLKEGQYTVYPVFRKGAAGEWQRMKSNRSFRECVILTLKDGTCTLSLATPDAQPKAAVTKMPEYFTSQSEYTVPVEFTNPGTQDYAGPIVGAFLTEDSKGELKVAARGRDLYVAIPAGKTVKVDYTSNVTQGSIVDGDYGFVIGNATTGDVISEMYTAKVGNRFGSLMMSYFNFEVLDRDFIDAREIRATADITVPQGQYKGPIGMLISMTKKNFTPVCVVESEPVELVAVETRNVAMKGAFHEAELGATYYCVPGYKVDDKWQAIGDFYLELVVGAVSAVSDLTAESDVDVAMRRGMATVISGSQAIAGIDAYGLDGRLVKPAVSISGNEASADFRQLPAGVYIIAITTADGNTYKAKLLNGK